MPLTQVMQHFHPDSSAIIYRNSLETLLREKGYVRQDRVMHFEVKPYWIEIATLDERLAIGAWKRRRLLSEKWGLKIFLGQELFAIQEPKTINSQKREIMDLSTINSVWIQQNPDVARLLSSQGTLSIHRKRSRSRISVPRHFFNPLLEQFFFCIFPYFRMKCGMWVISSPRMILRKMLAKVAKDSIV